MLHVYVLQFTNIYQRVMHVYVANVRTYMRCEYTYMCTGARIRSINTHIYVHFGNQHMLVSVCICWFIYVVFVPYMLSVYAQIGNVYVGFMPIYVQTVYVDLRAYMRFLK